MAKTWVKLILKAIPIDVVIDVILDWLEEQAEKTENTLDDEAIKIIKLILQKAFENQK